MLTHTVCALGAILLVITSAQTTETQSVEKAKAFRCFLENGVTASGELGETVAYTPDKFATIPADSIITVDVTGSRLTGNFGAQDVKIVRHKNSTDILAWSLADHLVTYTIFHNLPATMPKAAGGIIPKGYRVVSSRHLSLLDKLVASQYVGVCVVTD